MTTDAQNAINTMNQTFMAAVTRGDTATIAATYTRNGQIVPTHGDIITRRDAIQSFWQVLIDATGLSSVVLTQFELEFIGDTAWEVAKGTLIDKAGNVMDDVNYQFVWIAR